MKKRDYLYIALVVLAVLAVWNYGPAALSASGRFLSGGWTAMTAIPAETAAEAIVAEAANAQVPPTVPAPTAPAVEVKPNEADLCADQINPAWGNLIEKNTLVQVVYEAWLADVQANGGAVFGASKCSLPVDSRVFGPADEVAGSGPTQLVTDYRFSAIWHPEVDTTYEVAAGCVFEPLFAQGDAPIAVYRAPGTVRLQNNVSNGVSLVGIVTCNN